MTPTQRTTMYKMLGARGWRTSEPLSEELAPEVPRLADAISDSLVARGLTAQEVASIAGFASPEENRLLRVQGHAGLRLV